MRDRLLRRGLGGRLDDRFGAKKVVSRAGLEQEADLLVDADTELERTVQKAIAARGEELGVCYEKTLTDASPETSRVVFVIEIGRDGRASRVLEGRREGLSNEQVKCFARVLKARPFHDGASGDMRIQAPLAFVKKKSARPATSASPTP